MTHDVVPRRTYYSIFAALLALTALTVAVTFFELGRFNLVVALLIACTKASLVVWFFMHVRQSSPLTKIFLACGFFWFLILLILTFSDYLTRTWLPTPGGW